MSTYSSFLIRCWLKREGGEPGYVAEHVQTGAQFRSSDLEPICRWIDETNQQIAAQPDAQTES